jgi:AcrR family transcriptional regulator
MFLARRAVLGGYAVSMLLRCWAAGPQADRCQPRSIGGEVIEPRPGSVTEILTGTRQRLMRAARQVIEEGGYGAASVAAIAARADVAAGTLYRHFPSKEELFVEVFRSVCSGEERAMRAAAASMPAGAGAVERLEAVLATFAKRALRNPRLAWALIAEPVDRLVDAERLAYRARYASIVAAALREAISAGEVPDQDAEFTAAALVGGCGEALVGPLSPLASAAPPVDEVVSALTGFVRRAVGAV